MLSLTATQLPRFKACNGFRNLGTFESPDADNTSNDEGDAAHWVVEQAFKGQDPYSFIDREAPNGIFITLEMVEYCEAYIRDIKALGGSVEVNTSFTNGTAWEIRARADHIALAGTILFVNDFKYGRKLVEPENNWTLIWHAIGWLIQHQDAEITQVIFKIYQPRAYHPLGNVRAWHISKQELYELWGELQRSMMYPNDTCTTNDHCYKCDRRTTCPALQMAAMNSIDVSQKSFDSHVNNETLSFLLDQSTRAIKVLEQVKQAYEELAAHRIKNGETVPEYSVQKDLSNKQWKKGLTPQIMQSLTGIDLSKKQLITPNQAKQLGVDETVVETLCERNNKGLKLVRVDERKKAEKLLGKQTKGNL